MFFFRNTTEKSNRNLFYCFLYQYQNIKSQRNIFYQKLCNISKKYSIFETKITKMEYFPILENFTLTIQNISSKIFQNYFNKIQK